METKKKITGVWYVYFRYTDKDNNDFYSAKEIALYNDELFDPKVVEQLIMKHLGYKRVLLSNFIELSHDLIDYRNKLILKDGFDSLVIIAGEVMEEVEQMIEKEDHGKK